MSSAGDKLLRTTWRGAFWRQTAACRRVDVEEAFWHPMSRVDYKCRISLVTFGKNCIRVNVTFLLNSKHHIVRAGVRSEQKEQKECNKVNTAKRRVEHSYVQVPKIGIVALLPIRNACSGKRQEQDHSAKAAATRECTESVTYIPSKRPNLFLLGMLMKFSADSNECNNDGIQVLGCFVVTLRLGVVSSGLERALCGPLAVRISDIGPKQRP